MKLIKKFQLEIATLFVFIIFLSTLAPGIVIIDSGELSAAASTLGIAHPSGYPLFTILGFFLTKIFFFFPKIYTLNLFACFNATLGFYFLAKFNFELFKNFYSKKPEEIKSKSKKIKKSLPVLIDENSILLCSIIAALCIAFCRTFWTQGNAIEVYSLHLTLICASLFLFVKAINNSDKNDKKDISFKSEKHWIFFSFIYGLAFTNHLTTFLSIPGFAFYYFLTFRFNKKSFKRLALLLIPFLLALSVYLYLPLRAMQNPEINWGNPVTLDSLIRHIRGWQYTIWMFSSSEVTMKQFSYFFTNLPAQTGYIGIVLILAGLVYFARKYSKVFYFIFILILFTIFYAVNYDIKDIDSYFLLAYISFSPVIVACLLLTMKIAVKKEKDNSFVNFLFVFPLIILFINYSDSNESKNRQIHQYGKIALESVEKKSIIISYLWDFFVSPTYYFQYVENIRKDVAVIDKELVRRSWYFNQLNRNYPEIHKKIESQVATFLPELQKFERNQNYDGNLLDKYYKNILEKIITTNLNDKPIYLGPEMVLNEIRNKTFVLPDSLNIIPDLFFFRVINKTDSSYHTCKLPDFKIDFSEGNDYYTQTLKQLISVALINRAQYEMIYQQKDRAKLFYKKALEVDPATNIPNDLQNLMMEK